MSIPRIRRGQEEPDAGRVPTGSAEFSRQTVPYRKTYILPTPFGLAFALMLAALFLGAMNYNNNMAFLLAFLLAGTALLSMSRVHGNLVGLVIHPEPPAPVFAGENLPLVIHLENPSSLPRLGLVLRTSHLAEPGRAVDLPAHSSLTLTLSVPTRMRGWFAPPSLRLESRRPFGLFVAWIRLPPLPPTVIYPVPANPALPLPPPSTGSGSRRPDQADVEDFQGLRRYRPGDTLRHIHWPAYARGGGLLTKRFEAPPTETRILNWLETPGRLEERLSHLTRWIIELEAACCPYGLVLPNLNEPPQCNPDHHQRCLTALALYPEPPP
jgi:uncharacterized protein (DUF58 family)